MREPGFYWVLDGGKWTVGEWTDAGLWWVCGSDEADVDEFFAEIDEEMIVRRKP